MAVFSRLETLPSEVLEEIVVFAVKAQFLGPPTTLAVMLRVCRTISRALSRQNNPLLYARIFHCKLDVRAAVRRIGDHAANAVELANEIARRFEGLKRLKNNLYPRDSAADDADGGLKSDLWMAHLMFLENDGKNIRQLLQYARVDVLALDFVRFGGRLHDGAIYNQGWTVDNEVNALGLWLFWFTDKERVRSESVADREEILGALGCLFVGSFKYASAHAPITSSIIPPTKPIPLIQLQDRFSLSASPVHPPCKIPSYFGRELTLARLLITPPALLSCLVRLRGRDGSSQTDSSTTISQAEATRSRWTGALGEEFAVYERQGSSGVEWAEGGSERHDQDWMRLINCYDPWSRPSAVNRVFTPGQLDGVWEGRWLTLPHDYFHSLVHRAQEGTPITTVLEPPVYQKPMQFRIREHHQCQKEDVVTFDDISSDGVGSGALRAWFPHGTRMKQDQSTLEIYDPQARKPVAYRTCNSTNALLDEKWSGDGAPYSGGVWDIILTAETEDDFAAKWGYDRYQGRIRAWDGLVVLVREQRHGMGRWVFRGYLQNGQNLVGRWRETGTPVDAPGMEGVWGMVQSSM